MKTLWIGLLLVLWTNFCANAQESYPVITEIVTDKASIFSESQLLQLRQKLRNYEAETKHQIVVLTIHSLGNNTIENYAYRVFNREGNKFGQEGKDNGVLILFALRDKEVRIEVGDGLEPIITDAIASRIIRQIMIPEFKHRAYYQGIDKATSVITRLLEDPKYAEEFASQKKASKTLNVTPAGRVFASIIITPILLFLGLFGYNRLIIKKKKKYLKLKHLYKNNPLMFWSVVTLSVLVVAYFAKFFIVFFFGLLVISFLSVFVYIGAAIILRLAVKRAVSVFKGLLTGKLGVIIFPFYLPLTLFLLAAGYAFMLAPLVSIGVLVYKFYLKEINIGIEASTVFKLVFLVWLGILVYCLIKAIYEITKGSKAFALSFFQNTIKLEGFGSGSLSSRSYSSSRSSRSSSRSRSFSGGGGSSRGGGASGSW